jgi:hypothetical protein
MHIFTVGFVTVVLAMNVYIVYDLVQRYRADTHDEPWYMKLFHACRDSATVVVTKLATFISTFGLFLDPIAEMVGGDDLKQFVHVNFTNNPRLVAGIFLCFTAIIYFARMRTIWIAARSRLDQG